MCVCVCVCLRVHILVGIHLFESLCAWGHPGVTFREALEADGIRSVKAYWAQAWLVPSPNLTECNKRPLSRGVAMLPNSTHPSHLLLITVIFEIF